MTIRALTRLVRTAIQSARRSGVGVSTILTREDIGLALAEHGATVVHPMCSDGSGMWMPSLYEIRRPGKRPIAV